MADHSSPHPVRGNYDPDRKCRHTPDQRYTRAPCSCGRELWPPRGRGRGESLTSPRRIAAKLRALDALKLHSQGRSFRTIAALLGYHTPSGAWRAVQRLRDQEAAWARYEADGGTIGTRRRHQPTEEQLQQALEVLDAEIRDADDLNAEQMEQARERLQRLLVAHASNGSTEKWYNAFRSHRI